MKTNGRNTILDYTMKYRLKEKEDVMTSDMLVEWLDYDCEGILKAPSNFTSTRAWVNLIGCELYDPHMSKSSKMDN